MSLPDDPPPAPLRVWLLAGEASGDVLGARLVEALRRRRPDLVLGGVGGPRLEAQGLRSLFPLSELAVMGLVEVLPRVRRLRRLLELASADALAFRPDVVVTIDSPGFALRLLRRIAPSGVARVHYVAPQVWAWRERRVRHFPGLWDRLLCLLPFEPAFFARHGLEARFVGHPVLQSGADRGDAARFRARHGVAEGAPVVVLTEVEDKHDAYAAAACALTKSGTSTLELALAGVPMAVCYRVNPLTAAAARRLIRVPHVAMVNLLARRAVVPELLQGDCTPERLAATVLSLIRDPALAAAQRGAFEAVLASLRPSRDGAALPSEEAAAAVLEVADMAWASGGPAGGLRTG